MEIIVYRGISNIFETEQVSKGVIIGSWFSTHIFDAISFAQKTKGLVIKCSLSLKEEHRGEYLTSFDSNEEHKGWGVRDFDPKFAEGFWYFVDPSYIENVSLLEVYSFNEALEVEEQLYG